MGSQEKVQRTYNWVMSQDTKAGSPVPVTEGSQAAAGHHQPGQTIKPGQRRPEREREKEPETSTSCLDVSPPESTRAVPRCPPGNPLVFSHSAEQARDLVIC